MNVKIFEVWGTDYRQFIKEVEFNILNVDLIILNYLNECYNCYHDREIDINFFKLTNDHNIPVKIITSVYDKNDIKNTFQNVEFIQWETFWFYRTLKVWSNTSKINMTELELCKEISIDNSFICLNNIRKHHRSLVLDLLAKHELLKRGKVSWLNKVYGGHLGSDNFQYKYWKPEVLILDQTPDERFNQEKMPVEFYSSFMQLVTETEVEHIFITEKTATPILLNKIFLVAGAEKFHKTLQDFGFQLYTELFDYNFDEESDIELRTEQLVLNVTRYANMSVTDLNKIYKDTYEKIVYNKKLALHYARNIPENVLHIYNILLENNPYYAGSLNILQN